MEMSTMVSTTELNMTSGKVIKKYAKIQGDFISFYFSVTAFESTRTIYNNNNFYNIVKSCKTLQILHQLTARAMIRDYEDGILSEDKIQQRVRSYILSTPMERVPLPFLCLILRTFHYDPL